MSPAEKPLSAGHQNDLCCDALHLDSILWWITCNSRVALMTYKGPWIMTFQCIDFISDFLTQNKAFFWASIAQVMIPQLFWYYWGMPGWLNLSMGFCPGLHVHKMRIHVVKKTHSIFIALSAVISLLLFLIFCWQNGNSVG